MRLEQLVLFGPSDNFSIQFGPRVTVLAGLEPAERTGMVKTLVDAMAGRLPNASVIFVDEAGRRVFADRIGATYADTGVAAPSLSELVGTDPDVVADLVTLTAADLGLGDDRSTEALEADIAQAHAALAHAGDQQRAASAIVVEIEGWERDLAQLDEEIAHAPDEAARWEWVQLRNQLDAMRAELAALAPRGATDTEADARLLEAVEEVRSAGAAWAEASAEAAELSQRLGPLPPVSDADLARVAATPEAPPADLDDRLAALEAARAERVRCEEARGTLDRGVPDPGDGIVFNLAQLDQDHLWQVHGAAVRAAAEYETELARHSKEPEPELDGEIELAHHRVIAAQEVVDQRVRPGIVGAGATLAGALLASMSLPIVVTLAMVVGAVALGVWLVWLPQKALREAQFDEEMALTGSEVNSWLGLHLRRLDDVAAPADRRALSAALELRSRTRLAWDDLAEGTSLEAAAQRQQAIRAHAALIDPSNRGEREREALDALAEASEQERLARRALVADLEAYGLTADAAADLSPDQIGDLLRQRAAAGRFAREALRLQELLARATAAGGLLDRLLRGLGFDDGDLAGRLERAIASIEAARARRGDSGRDRKQLEREIARLADEVERRRRLSWDALADPDGPPRPTAELMDARRALAARIEEVRRPDLAGHERKVAVATERLRALEAELASAAEGPTSIRRRLADRIGRTSYLGPHEETLPLLIDDALVDVEPEELFKMLDMIVRLSDRTQIVLLSSDPTITRWGRREAAHGTISLFEADGVAVV
ncbi:MAG: hypothetical protein KDA98_09830 [Acidimicrobiales bacterium]|nr:hypothetical protein [Acidimicrobiales bacterium]